MRLGLEVIRARKGDCLMLHYGTAKYPRTILIDGGPSGVYEPHLKASLSALRAARGLGDGEGLDLDMIMVSHVDDDHIKGLLDMTRELLDQQAAQQPVSVRTRTLWHNSFPDILGARPAELASVRPWGPAALTGVAPEADDLEEGDHDLALLLASVGQGAQLRDDARALKWPLNRQFKGKLVCADVQPTRIKMPGGVTLTVIGPLRPELEALWAEHQKWLKAKAASDKAEAAKLQAYIDGSVPNLSSLVVLAEAKGRSLLLTGDARGDKVLEGLRAAGRLDDTPGAVLHVDVLKVPHHGSANNLETGFFRQITADHYVFTGDGEHGNPEREAFEMLFDARPGADFDIHLCYPIAEIDPERRKDWEKQQASEKRRRDKAPLAERPNRKVRDDWSDAVNGLATLFQARGFPAERLHVAPDQKGHVIELLGPG
ncbi:MAG: hypothetical protein KF842_14195 [Caulobacter sp.]|nr:hypothetical protein [Caulobacter sp.]